MMLAKFSMPQLRVLIYDALQAKRYKSCEGSECYGPSLIMRKYSKIQLVSNNADTCHIQAVHMVITSDIQAMIDETGCCMSNYGAIFGGDKWYSVEIPIIQAMVDPNVSYIHVSVDEPELRVLLEDYSGVERGGVHNVSKIGSVCVS